MGIESFYCIASESWGVFLKFFSLEKKLFLILQFFLFLVKFSNYSFQFKHSHPSSIKLFNILDILDLLYAPADDILISSPCISRSWYLDTFARLCQVYKFPFHFFSFACHEIQHRKKCISIYQRERELCS
jgi:hypothetical protein